MRWTFSGFVPSSNVRATCFWALEPCDTTVAGSAPAGGGKQPWASAVGAGSAVALRLGMTDTGPVGADVAAATVGVGPTDGVASAVSGNAGRVKPEATIAPTTTIATAPANARK